MKKVIVSVIVVFALLFTMLPVAAFAQDESVGKRFTEL